MPGTDVVDDLFDLRFAKCLEAKNKTKFRLVTRSRCVTLYRVSIVVSSTAQNICHSAYIFSNVLIYDNCTVRLGELEVSTKSQLFDNGFEGRLAAKRSRATLQSRCRQQQGRSRFCRTRSNISCER